MKRIIAGLLFIFLLSACMPSDPYAMRAAADSAIQATQAAYSDRAQVATIEAGREYSSQTAQAGELFAQSTATADAFNFQSTAQAATAQALQTQATATAQAVGTATAWSITSTPLAATQAAIIRQMEEDTRRAEWQARMIPVKEIAPVLFGLALLVLVIMGLVLAWRRFAPVVELRLRSFNRGEHDAPLIVLPGMVIDPDKQFGPALRILGGDAHSTGHAPTPELQDRTTARQQAVKLLQALPQDKQERKAAGKLLSVLNIPALPSGAGLPKVEVIEAGEATQVGNWLGEVEHKLLAESEEL